MQGAGNDFIIVDGERFPKILNDEEFSKNFAREFCSRNFSVGADGLIVFSKSQEAQVKMRYHNADGGRSVCGNGLRCLAALFLNPSPFSSPEGFGLPDDGQVAIETDTGVAEISLVEVLSEKESLLQVNMGSPDFSPEGVPTTASKSSISEGPKGYRLDIMGEEVQLHAASMGNPHAVVFVDRLNREKFLRLAPEIDRHSFFPEGCNAHFVEQVGDKSYEMLIWERGVGETLACGTGFAAVYAILRELGEAPEGSSVRIKSLGGDFLMQSVSDADETELRDVLLTGPAKLAFKGSVTVPGL